MKNATQKRSIYLERAEKIIRNDINGIRISRFNGELPALKQGKKIRNQTSSKIDNL